ncbi:hypothetical protein PGT21_011870 [Puccinia graminis f. sp. tritici]|uniref:Uncharacterized protein n=1 Tax=Puccinia graminis f. sp. tritici TaxID=56615 RepID=A0A5B0PVP4_PUCGR|nr:hypothetical protein PGT21_011870 [Puccinia graminis f. sp. tritici]KAA1128194.1 hypothetical protein PGTUg99_003435 [Puccinia graminis f. sp. tritici]
MTFQAQDRFWILIHVIQNRFGYLRSALTQPGMNTLARLLELKLKRDSPGKSGGYWPARPHYCHRAPNEGFILDVYDDTDTAPQSQSAE